MAAEGPLDLITLHPSTASDGATSSQLMSEQIRLGMSLASWHDLLSEMYVLRTL